MNPSTTFFDGGLVEDWQTETLKLQTKSTARPMTVTWSVESARADKAATQQRIAVLKQEIAMTAPRAQLFGLLSVQGLLMVNLSNYWILLFLFAMPVALRHIGHLITAYFALQRAKKTQ